MNVYDGWVHFEEHERCSLYPYATDPPPDGRSGIDARTYTDPPDTMQNTDHTAPMVPMITDPTTHTTRTDGGETGSEHGTRRSEQPPGTACAEADRHREEIEPGAADLR